MIIVRTPCYAVLTDELLRGRFYGAEWYFFEKLARRNLIPVEWERDEMRFCWVLFMVQYHVHPRRLEPPVGIV